MFLDVSAALRAEGELLPFEARVDASEASRDDAVLSNALIKGKMAGIGERVTLIGTVTARVTACCARCTKEFETSLSVPYEAIFARPGEESADEDAGGNDPDLYFFEGSQVEPDESAVASLALNMPMRFLCNADCKGLCPVCGMDLNEKDCSCETVGEDSPFTALKALFTDEKEVNPHGGTER